jgi:hypothetical protein
VRASTDERPGSSPLAGPALQGNLKVTEKELKCRGKGLN